MNALKARLQKLWDAMCDPRWKKPLLITGAWLLLILLGLILLRRSGGAAPEENSLRRVLAKAVPAPEETALPAAEAIPAELVPAEEPFPGWRRSDGKDYYLDSEGKPVRGLRRIDGKLCYFDENGVKARALGIDVSFYNARIEWDQVKAQGIDFAIIRVGGRYWTGGGLYEDCRLEGFLRGAKARGIPVGVYFYSTAVSPEEAIEEAQATLRALNGIRLELPVFIDLEYSGQFPRGRADRLDGGERTEIARAFCETVRAAGYRAGVYAGQNFFKSAIHYHALSRYAIWLASYTAENRLPLFHWRYDLWQFTDSGRLFGVSGEVDLNAVF